MPDSCLPHAAGPAPDRDLASTDLWALSLDRSRRRRALAAAAHRRAVPGAKGAAAVVGAALVVSPGLALASAISARPAADARSASPTPRPRHADGSILKRGDVNGTVAKVQRALGIDADRIFGPLTQRAVQDLQARASLPRSGAVDPQTWLALSRSPTASAARVAARPAPSPSTSTSSAARAGSAPAPRSGAVGGSTSTSTAAGGSCGAKLFAPLRGKVASPFGDGRLHAGIDISAPVGTSVLAAACGTVTLAGRQSGYGKIVCIRHTQSFSTCYAHLSTFAVKPGSPVVVGQLIGRVGMTGRTSGPHLHFETRVDGRAQNPAPFLRGSRRIPGATAPASSPAPEAQATGGARPATTPG